MTIKVLLIVALLIALAVVYLNRKRSRLVGILVSLTCVAGIYFVVRPDDATRMAALLDVGRGADLVFYCWIVISLVVSLFLYFKVLDLEASVTQLTRALALRDVRERSEPE